MKTTKKTLALLIVLVMIAAMLPNALAADSYTITISNSATGHTYEAYQIFTGDLAADGTLSNIKWGSGISEAGKTALGDAAAKAETLKTEADAKAFAKEVAPYLSTVAGSANTVVDGKYSISGLAAGYYLVKDQDGSLTGDNDSYTEYVLKVVSNTTVTPKSNLPTVQKKVRDINNSTESVMTDWQDSADHDIGDNVPFQLKATLANNVSSYTTYKVVFHDTLSKGLTFDNNAKVMIGSEDKTSSFTITPTVNADNTTTLTVSCDDVKALGAGNSAVITVEYTATLNSDAVIGSAGNPNKVYLEYSNNPNKSESGNNETGNTPEDVVIVFTYKTVVNKVTKNPDYDASKDPNDTGIDTDNNKKYIPLKGAGFTLYKKNTTTDDYEAVGTQVTGTDMTTFTWSGLDDGEYKLVETTTPAGYNTISDIEFTITAEHDVVSDNPALTSLSGGNKFTGEVSTGAVSADIENLAGNTLPSTGGIGTTMFYVIGSILVIGAVVLLVSKKRMNAAE